MRGAERIEVSLRVALMMFLLGPGQGLVGCSRPAGPGSDAGRPVDDQRGASADARVAEVTRLAGEPPASAADRGTESAAVAPAWSDGLAEIARGSNRFAITLHRTLSADGGNLFFSPFSIHAALAMTATGARGATFEQMREVLQLPDRDALPAAGDLARFHASAGGPSELALASALWGQAGTGWKPEFLDLLRDRFDAGFQEADFAANPDAERIRINGWVAERTRNRIAGLLPAGALSPLTRLVLANAIYFHGDWQSQFDPARTAPEPFHRADGNAAPVPLMHRKGRERHFAGSFGAAGAEFQLLILPYRGRQLEMVVILPRATDGLAALEEALSAEALEGWSRDAEPVEVEIRLPRFRIDHRFEAAAMLSAMGMPDLFIPGKADLSGMNQEEPLAVSKVVHQAFVEVNEEGTEAAAATAVISNAPAPPPPRPVEFRADRPFLFLIRDAAHRTILFLGRLVDPQG